MKRGTAISLLLALPVALPSAYLGVLTLFSKTPDAPFARATPNYRFAVVVPAHDEEAGIEATVKSLLAMDYPRELFSVVVIADNCSDRTAERARAAGARVIERTDRTKRGKGFALERAFEELLGEGTADAIVVVDADTTVTENLLRAFDARMAQGAVAMQAEYGVRNPDASWRTRLMTVAFSVFHGVRGSARERLGLSAGLRGNGMAFAASVLREVPHDAYGLVEDVEYGIRLGRAGHRVAHVHEARVFGDMVASEEASRSQRKRWEEGRAKLRREVALPLLREAFAQRSPLLFDLAADLLVPPLSTVAAGAAVGLVGSIAWTVARRGRGAAVVLPWALSTAALGAYVVRGALMSDAGPRALLDLAWAPVYVAWKGVLKVRRPAPAPTSPRAHAESAPEWVRTERGK
jgi:cellulose synthase/poly-beta-1,6-N-acetylglucosamine synthase-like glycosyltransferase